MPLLNILAQEIKAKKNQLQWNYIGTMSLVKKKLKWMPKG